MAQRQIENGMSGTVVRENINENFSELYTGKADNNHASSATTYGVATTSLFGHIKVTTGNGLNLNNGTLSLAAASTSDATAGTSTNVVMTPARVKDAINAFGVQSDGNLIIKWGTRQPAVQSGKTIIWIDTSS